MIRLGSLAGYLFDGPRLLGGWQPPGRPGVYAVLYRPDPEGRPERYAVVYIGQSVDLSAEGFPFRHPRAACWTRRAGDRWRVYIATYEMDAPGHREAIARELTAIYRPRCNRQQYESTWRDEWIPSG